ncbi:hypothetical protein BGZ83_004520 [Gryganskiella cystojenkinii]|nr:hypothetical protein BGZ83_004520 [Gryganskiella cystojenkinii]
MDDSERPMDLPEIRMLVAYFLNTRSLAVGTRVCKAWRDSFIPILYYSLVVNSVEHSAAFPHCYPSAGTLEKYCHHIRDLSTVASQWYLNILIMEYCNLRRLNLTVDSASSPHALNGFIGLNPRLLELSIDSTSERNYGDSGIATKISSTCLSLKKLVLKKLQVPHPLGEILQPLSAALRALHLVRCSVRVGPLAKPANWPCFPQLQSLHLELATDMTLDQQLELIQNCPRLRTLTWKHNDPRPASQFLATLLDVPMPDHLLYPPVQPFPEEAFTNLFAPDFCPYLNATHVDLHELTDRVLETGLETWMGQEILSSCAHLEEFTFFKLDPREFSGDPSPDWRAEYNRLFKNKDSTTTDQKTEQEDGPVNVHRREDPAAATARAGSGEDQDSSILGSTSTTIIIENSPSDSEQQDQDQDRDQDQEQEQEHQTWQPHPWLCRNLQILNTTIDCDDDPEVNARVMNQLAAMLCLERVTITGERNTFGRYFGYLDEPSPELMVVNEDLLNKPIPEEPLLEPEARSSWIWFRRRHLSYNEILVTESLRWIKGVWTMLDTFSFLPIDIAEREEEEEE